MLTVGTVLLAMAVFWIGFAVGYGMGALNVIKAWRQSNADN